MPSLVDVVTDMMRPKQPTVVVKTIKSNGDVVTKPLSAQGDIFTDPYDDKAYDAWNRRAYSYGGGGKYTTPATTPSSTRKVEVTFPTGAIDRWTIPYDGKGWWDIATTVWPVRAEKSDDIMTVPSAHCEFSYGEPKFNACVYTGTTDYLQARWGRKLDDSDRRWLAAHPYATDGGIPQEYTATCIDQLAMPYGMRVSRVRIRKGALVLGDSLMGWLMALGCNPMAMADRSTSNAEAAEKLGLPLDQANQLWRVEFHDEPLPCSIIGERGWTSSTGVSTGSFGGHCRYLAPRAKAGDWFISVQLDMDTTVSHLVPPPNPEYVPRKGDPTLLYTEITGPDHTLIAIKVNSTWAPASGGPVQVTPEVTTAVTAEVVRPRSSAGDEEEAAFWRTYGGLDQDVLDAGPIPCELCDSKVFEDELYEDSFVCLACAEEAWQGLRCPHCDEVFGAKVVPHPIACDEDTADYACPACYGEIQVSAGQYPYVDAVTAAIFGAAAIDPDMPTTPEVPQ